MEKSKIYGIFVICLVSTLTPILILSFSLKSVTSSYITYANSSQISFLINNTLYDNNVTLNLDDNSVVNLSIYFPKSNSDTVNRTLMFRLKGMNLNSTYQYNSVFSDVNTSILYDVSFISLNSMNITIGMNFGLIGKHTLIIQAYTINYRDSVVLKEELAVFALKSEMQAINLTLIDLETLYNSTVLRIVNINDTCVAHFNELVEVNNTLNILISNYTILQNNFTSLQNKFDELEVNCNATQEMLSELSNLTETMNGLYDSIDNLTLYYTEISENYTLLLEDFTDLYNNFTDYVELLESFGNITALIQDINADILAEHNRIDSLTSSLTTEHNRIDSLNSTLVILNSNYNTLHNEYNNLSSSFDILHHEMHHVDVWEANMSSSFASLHGNVHSLDSLVSALDSRVDEIEFQRAIFEPFQQDWGYGWTLDYSGTIPFNYYILNSNTDNWFSASFIVRITSTSHFRVTIITTSTVASRTNNGHYYVNTGISGTAFGLGNVVNGDALNLANTNADAMYFTQSSDFSMGGSVDARFVSVMWHDDYNAGTGYTRLLGCFLTYIHVV